MSLFKVLTNQTTDTTIVVGAFNGLFQIELVGTLGAATFTTEIQSTIDPSVWIPIADGTWLSSGDSPFNGNDAAMIVLVNSNVRVVLSGSDGSTNISCAVKS